MREWINPYNPFNSQKALVHGCTFKGIVEGDLLPPVVVNLDVAGVCNYACPHCHHKRKQIKDRSLPFLDDKLAREFPSFMRNWQVYGHSPKGCCIVGSKGDALLYPKLPELLRSLFFNGIEVGLVSNGYAYNEHLLEYAAHYCKFVGFSIDAGDEESYNRIHRPPEGAWDRVLGNISALVDIISRNRLINDVGFKVLVLPQSYHTIYDACKIAKGVGARYVQIRPADLSQEERALINIDHVNDQIDRAMSDFNEPGVFEIVGVKHKFNKDFTKVLPNYCYLTALTVTITSDGKCWPCVDRRWDEPTLLADCGEVKTWKALKEVWGSSKHLDILHRVINNNGAGPTCDIRCSNFGYATLFENYFITDATDRNLI